MKKGKQREKQNDQDKAEDRDLLEELSECPGEQGLLEGSEKKRAWRIDGRGLWHADERGNERFVTSTPPRFVESVYYPDVDRTLTVIAFTVAGREVQCVCDRADLLSNNKIVGLLAPLGANVSSSNSKGVVAYLTWLDSLGFSQQKVVKGSTTLGWVKGRWGPSPHGTSVGTGLTRRRTSSVSRARSRARAAPSTTGRVQSVPRACNRLR